MKKIFSVLLLLCLFVGIAGCGNTESKPKTDKEVYEQLEKAGYEFTVTNDSKDEGIGSLIIISNDGIKGIMISKFKYKDEYKKTIKDKEGMTLEDFVFFSDKSVNKNGVALILNEDSNNGSEEDKEQYKAYLKWLDQQDLTTQEIENVLLYAENK